MSSIAHRLASVAVLLVLSPSCQLPPPTEPTSPPAAEPAPEPAPSDEAGNEAPESEPQETPEESSTAKPASDRAPHSIHHDLQLDGDPITAASVEVRIDEVPRHGLRFFALQVDFAEVAWAHGGLQADPSNGKANWGGLASGIDYSFEGSEATVLSRIQNAPGRVAAVSWQTGTWYRYTVTRGPEEVLPAGSYAVLDETPRPVATARKMWRWDFEIRDIGTNRVVWHKHLHVAHPMITSITYWTETGYGITCDDKLSVSWRNPYYWAGNGQKRLPLRVAKSMSQSTCPSGATTDMGAANVGGVWGTRQTYGRPRQPGSTDGQVIYERAAN